MKDIVNHENKQEIKMKHHNNQKWRNFAQRVQKNPFVRDYLKTKYGNTCQYCGTPIKKNMQVIHKTYDRECLTDKTIMVSSADSNVAHKVPDCEHCAVFYECIDDSIYPVHAMCNLTIHRGG